jgi:hypothetical protein
VTVWRAPEIPAAQQLVGELGAVWRRHPTEGQSALLAAQCRNRLRLRQPSSSDTEVTPGRRRHETRTAEIFSATSAIAGTEWKPLIKVIVPIVRDVLHRDAKTGLWSSTAEVAYCVANTPYRRAMPPPQSDATGTWRTACTTLAMSSSRRISALSVTTPASLPGCAPPPTASCVAIRLQRSVGIATPPPRSAVPTCSPSGALVESVEQPCRWDEDHVQGEKSVHRSWCCSLDVSMDIVQDAPHARRGALATNHASSKESGYAPGLHKPERML